VHGGIDGYSQLIVFLCCSSNYRSSTVFSHFMSVVQRYGLPSRVRSDQGCENMMVARYMLEHRGTQRSSMLTGSSIHNQKIEGFGVICLDVPYSSITAYFTFWKIRIN